MGTLGMLPDSAGAYKDRIDLVIDHHGSNEGYGRETCVDPSCAACGELLYRIFQAGKVFLFPFRSEFHRPGGPPHENRQNAGGHGVQGAGVADPSLPEKSPELGNHIVAGPAGGFVDD